MSRLAQAVARAVQELRASGKYRARARRRVAVEDDRTLEDTSGPAYDEAVSDETRHDEPAHDPTTTGGVAEDVTAMSQDAMPAPGGADEGDDQMAKKMKRGKRAKSDKRKRQRRVTAEGGRLLKHYRLVDGIPKDLRDPSAGRAILEAIKARGSATNAMLREDLGKKFKVPTLRFYLGKFQREKIVKAAKQ